MGDIIFQLILLPVIKFVFLWPGTIIRNSYFNWHYRNDKIKFIYFKSESQKKDSKYSYYVSTCLYFGITLLILIYKSIYFKLDISDSIILASSCFALTCFVILCATE